jgi:hypothetical protein
MKTDASLTWGNPMKKNDLPPREKKELADERAQGPFAIEDQKLLELGERFKSIFLQHSEAVSAYSRAEYIEPKARVKNLDNLVRRHSRRLLNIQYQIALTPAHTLKGLRVKARVFAGRWRNPHQMKQWMISCNGNAYQDPQVMMGASIALDLLQSNP